jgi:hypothetical protein
MKYMLLMYWNQAEAPDLSSPEAQQAAAKAWQALLQDARAADVLVSQNGVAPDSSTTTVRVREGKSMITDGPFAETHEQLGGYFLIDVENLDEAIRWAEKIPAVQYGSIEIRPLWSPG